MPNKLPQISGQEAIRKLEQIGYQVIRQRGSHIRMASSDPSRRKLTVPLHKSLKKGLLHQLIQDANITMEKFLEL